MSWVCVFVCACGRVAVWLFGCMAVSLYVLLGTQAPHDIVIKAFTGGDIISARPGLLSRQWFVADLGASSG